MNQRDSGKMMTLGRSCDIRTASPLPGFMRGRGIPWGAMPSVQGSFGHHASEGSRSITVHVADGRQRGHGRHGHVGLLAVIHPIMRGERIYGDLSDAAERYSLEAEQACLRSGIAMNDMRNPGKSALSRAAAVLILEGLEGQKVANAQFNLGVMLWKGQAVKRFPSPSSLQCSFCLFHHVPPRRTS